MSLESKKPWQQASYREPTTSQKTDWNTSSTTILTNENIPPLICSCRLVFAVCAFIALFNMSIMRFNLSFAVVCMVHSEAANKTLKTIEMNCSRSTHVAEPYERQGEFHWSRSQQGRVLSGFFYGFLTSQTLGGWVSDRWGGKRPFILGNVLQGFFAVLMPLAARWTPEALFVLRILQGVASGLSVPAFFQLGARWTAPAERTLLMGLAVAGFPVANIAIYPIAAFLCNYGIDGGWPSIFYATGAFGAGCAVLSYYFIYDLPNDHPRISDEEKRYLNSVTIQGKKPIKIPWKNLLSSGPIFAYFVSHFCFTWGYVTIAIHLPLFLDQVMLFDRNMNGLLSSVPFIGILVSRIIISTTFHPCQVKSGLNSTNKRKLNHTIGSLFVALCLVGVSMMSCSQRIEAVVLLAAGMAVAELAYTGGYGFTLLQIVPRLAGTLSGTSNALANCSGIICPFIVAMVTPNGTQKEWAIVLYITSALYVVQCVTYLIFGSVELVPWAKEDEPAPENSGVKST